MDVPCFFSICFLALVSRSSIICLNAPLLIFESLDAVAELLHLGSVPCSHGTLVIAKNGNFLISFVVILDFLWYASGGLHVAQQLRHGIKRRCRFGKLWLSDLS